MFSTPAIALFAGVACCSVGLAFRVITRHPRAWHFLLAYAGAVLACGFAWAEGGSALVAGALSLVAVVWAGLYGGLALAVAVCGGLATILLAGPQGGAGDFALWFMETFGWSREAADVAVIVIRKSVHFAAYGLMGLSLFIFSRTRRPLWAAAALGVVWAVGHGALDEFRQSLSAARTGSVFDVLIDALGAATFIAIAARWRRRP